MSSSRRATYEDVLAAPPNVIAEIVEGVLHTQPRRALRHARATTALGQELGSPFQRGRGGPGGWIIVYEPEVHLGSQPDILVPDLAGWRRERLPELPDAAFLTLAPDWICEVLSPSTAGYDRVVKMSVYAREGVRHLWLVDPVEKTLEVFRLETATWTRVGAWQDDALVRAEPFDAIELEIERLWKD